MKLFFPCLFLILFLFSPAEAQRLSGTEQIPMASYQGMKEVERYQLKVAEKYYLKKEYKISMSEYEKFLSLYEESSGAPYAQLMWSQCLLKLRKVNTAIREGFQSVVDYWPDSAEARTAFYLIARSYQDMGETNKAKAAYREVMENDPDGDLAVLSRASLLEIAKTEQDDETVIQLLEELTYRTKRTDASRDACTNAARDLARYYTSRGNAAEAIRALETSYDESRVDHYLYHYGVEGLRKLHSKDETKENAVKMAKRIVEHFESRIPASLEEESAQNRAVDAFAKIASVYGALRDTEKVLKTFEKSAKLLGESDRLLGQMAGYYKSIGDRDKAREAYLRYENQSAGNSAIAYMFREEKKYDEAIKIYRELTVSDAKGINNYLWAIAECYEGKSDWKNAAQAYRQTDRFPSNYLRMANCHRRLKQWKEALGLYNQVKSSEQHAPEATYLMGHTYEEAGQRENAIKAFQLTCRSFPKSQSASRAHAHLQTKYKITATFGGATDE
jgi:TolA-binding protein